MKDIEVWEAKDGTVYKVPELSDSHLLNIERFLSFRGATAPTVPSWMLLEQTSRIDKEIAKRGLERLPTIRKHKDKPCPAADVHSDAMDITDWYPCLICSN